VRNPYEVNTFNPTSTLGIRDLSSEHVQKNYRKFLDKALSHDPVHHIGSLQITGESATKKFEQSLQFPRVESAFSDRTESEGAGDLDEMELKMYANLFQ
jgi:hypothetical protein